MSAPVIPGYTYIEHLGSGGFADVFLYEQQWPQQRVAIKIVRPDVPLTEREKQLFTAEANAMARLADHPYIVSVITAGVTQDSGRPYLVMRYCPPPDLGVRVRSNPMPVVDAVSTGIKLASAIETAHRSGILHRDIKPSNVLVTTYHEPALTDFGIAGHMADVEGDNDVRISYPWSPPELLDGTSNGSVSSDVYALGATIWHLLVGRSPFSIPAGDNSTRALSARILHAAPPATQRPDVPPALDSLLQQCLAKRPEHRPSSALELAMALQRIEAAAGWQRTMVAVEGDRGAQQQVFSDLAGPDDGQTVMKAPTVISASAPRRVASAQQRSVTDPAQVEDEEETGGISGFVWAAIGVAVVAALALALIFTDQRDPEPPGTPDPSTTTPAPLVQDLDRAPAVTGRRNGEKVIFSWEPGGSTEPGDLWILVNDDGQVTRTEKQRMVIGSGEGVCVEVFQRRGGIDSPATRSCVG